MPLDDQENVGPNKWRHSGTDCAVCLVPYSGTRPWLLPTAHVTLGISVSTCSCASMHDKLISQSRINDIPGSHRRVRSVTAGPTDLPLSSSALDSRKQNLAPMARWRDSNVSGDLSAERRQRPGSAWLAAHAPGLKGPERDSPSRQATTDNRPVPAPISNTALSNRFTCCWLLSKNWHKAVAYNTNPDQHVRKDASVGTDAARGGGRSTPGQIRAPNVSIDSWMLMS